ncbi:MAG: outer membrane protein assembly factor BamA [Bacteroidetes bacterium]|nr:outer membrane protein assembly factor BamA [Bacteroidota bacterium]
MHPKLAFIFIVFFLLFSILQFPALLNAQIPLTDDLSKISYEFPVEYEIGGITVSVATHFDPLALGNLAGLSIGEKIMIPGDKIADAIRTLWKQGLFDDISIRATSIVENRIFLELALTERPRLSKFSFTGIRKGEADELREKIKLFRGKTISDELFVSTDYKVKEYFIEKGFFNISVNLVREKDPEVQGSEILNIRIKKGKRVKVNDIIVHGNEFFTDKKVRRYLKNTKKKRWWNIFKMSKYIPDNFDSDKSRLISKYNEQGYRDAKTVRDTFYRFDEKTVNVELEIAEGKKFYFRNITWVGNTKHTAEELNTVLGIKKGDVFNQSLLDNRLFMNPNGRDVSSLYLDDGYLFFNLTPVETAVESDSIDLEMRIYEGRQATIRRVTVSGNTKTHDHVVLRELRTRPGQLFSRADIIRSQRELAQLGYFDPEKLSVNPKPNPADGTVDIDYVVEEKSSDQIELSGGYGGNRLIGSLGISFNNFSARNFFKGSAWTPLPAGDGQKISVRAQSTGAYYQSYTLSFTEPWLGGKKPNAFSITGYHTVLTNAKKKSDPLREALYVTGISNGLGKRLKWPDDYFSLYHAVNYQHYKLKNYTSLFSFSNGNSNNIHYSVTLSRNSLDQPLYPRTGSEFAFTVEATPPFSLFRNVDFDTLAASDKYKWIEYHKWKVKVSWFTKIVQNLVLMARLQYGFVGMYNRNYGMSPFEKFVVGGSGLSGISGFVGRDIIPLRGYEEGTLSTTAEGDPIFSRYYLELRYPLSLNPNATIYVHGFLEAGRSWTTFKSFRPFDVKRSAGVGIRMFIFPIGLIGFDFGYGFDTSFDGGGKKWVPHFVIGYSIE